MTKKKLVELVEALEGAGFEVISLKEETCCTPFTSGDFYTKNRPGKTGVIAFEVIDRAC
jgi:hypothetical protein